MNLNLKPKQRAEKMTRAEQHDILVVMRQRTKLAKDLVEKREHELLADFEEQLAKIYQPKDGVTWEQFTEKAEAIIEELNRTIRVDLAETGVPEWAMPEAHVSWYGRGQNAVKERRAELRKVATTRIEALGREAKTEIDRRSLEAQTALIANGLECAEARAWLEKAPSVKELMPAIKVSEIELLHDSEAE